MHQNQHNLKFSDCIIPSNGKSLDREEKLVFKGFIGYRVVASGNCAKLSTHELLMVEARSWILITNLCHHFIRCYVSFHFID